MPFLNTLRKPDIEYDFCATFHRNFPPLYAETMQSPIVDSNGNTYEFEGTAVFQCMSEEHRAGQPVAIKVWYKVLPTIV
jgi:hypothetical protein